MRTALSFVILRESLSVGKDSIYKITADRTKKLLSKLFEFQGVAL